MVGMRKCGRCSSLRRVDVSFVFLLRRPCGEAWVAHPKRLTSLRDEWRLIGVRHPSFYVRAQLNAIILCVKFFGQQHAGWGRQMRRHSSRSDVSRVCLPQLASSRTKKRASHKNEKPFDTTCGLRSHRKRHELRPRADTSLSRGGLTDLLQNEVPQLYRFFPT